MAIRVIIADDHPLIVAGLRAITVGTEIEIVGHVDSCERLLGLLDLRRPDVLLAEIRIDACDVIRELEAYVSEENSCAVVFLTANQNPTHLARAGSLGCHDYISKKSDGEEILAAIRSAARGGPTPPTSRLKKAQAKIQRSLLAVDWDAVEVELTPREKQVLQHLALGMTNREIGRSLSISSTTVKEYVQKIMRKLEANDRTQAAVWAVREGII